MPIKAFKQTRFARTGITDYLLRQIRELFPDKTAADSDEVLRIALDNAITDAAKVEYVFDTRNNRPTLLVDVSAYYKDTWILGTQNDKPGRGTETAYVTALTARVVQGNLRDGTFIASTREEYTVRIAKAVAAPPAIDRAVRPTASPSPQPSLDDGEQVIVLQREGQQDRFKVCSLAEAKEILTEDPSTRIFKELKTKRRVTVEISQ